MTTVMPLPPSTPKNKETNEDYATVADDFIPFIERAEALNSKITDKDIQESIRMKLMKVKKLWKQQS